MEVDKLADMLSSEELENSKHRFKIFVNEGVHSVDPNGENILMRYLRCASSPFAYLDYLVKTVKIDVTSIDKMKCTTLHHAVSNPNCTLDVISYLVAAGA
jgi:hypothetical protein